MSSKRHKNILPSGCREAKPGLSSVFVSYIWWQPSLSGSWRTRCRTNKEFAMAEHRCGELELQLYNLWFSDEGSHCRNIWWKKTGRLELRSRARRLSEWKNRWHAIFFIPFSLLMWSINIQPATHRCHAMGLRRWITSLCAQTINITCGQWLWYRSHFLVTPYLFWWDALLSLFGAKQCEVYFAKKT